MAKVPPEITAQASGDFLLPALQRLDTVQDLEAAAVQEATPLVLRLWHNNEIKNWISAKFVPPERKGTFLLLYFVGGDLNHAKIGWAHFYPNTGWSALMTFSQVQQLDRNRLTTSVFAYELPFLYWKGLSHQPL